MRRARLGEICEIQLGKMLSPAARQGESPSAYLRNANVQWNRFDLGSIARMDFDEREREKFSLRRGDVLVCEGGEPGRAAVWNEEIAPCYFQKALHRLRPKNGEIIPQFVVYVLWSAAMAGTFRDSIGQATIAHLPAVTLAALEIPLPPLDRQREIVAQLDAQLAAAARARAAVAAQLADAEKIARAILREEFEAAHLQSAPACRLEEVASLLPSRSVSNSGDSLVSVATSACLTEWGFTSRGIKPNRMESSALSDCLATRGEVLVARSNTAELVGRASFFPGSANPVYIADLLMRVKCSDRLSPEFTAFYLSFLYADGFWRERAGGASGSMKKIRREQLLAVKLPLLSITDQTTVASRISYGLEKGLGLVATLTARLAELDRLPAALLRAAFTF